LSTKPEDWYREVGLCLLMERSGDCDCCFCLSQGRADATLDCGLRRWPEVGFEEIIHRISPKPVSGQPVNSDRSLDTSAVMGTDQDAPRPVSFDNVNLCSKSSGLQGVRRNVAFLKKPPIAAFAVVVRWGRSTVGARRSVGASDTESDTCRAYGRSARLSSQDSSTRVDVDCAQDF
jgi:hypothetical protein